MNLKYYEAFIVHTLEASEEASKETYLYTFKTVIKSNVAVCKIF